MSDAIENTLKNYGSLENYARTVLPQRKSQMKTWENVLERFLENCNGQEMICNRCITVKPIEEFLSNIHKRSIRRMCRSCSDKANRRERLLESRKIRRKLKDYKKYTSNKGVESKARSRADIGDSAYRYATRTKYA
jgi:hypothetical protein